MLMSSEAMHQLSVETRAKLRSAQLLTSLPQVVSELLQNSLDAGASQVDIGVNCEEWSCWVRDDGAGINKSGLTMIGKGSDEGRYNTSKAYTPASLESVSTFGFRGEALSSMAELCCLEISSRTSMSRESWAVILKGGKSLYSGPSIRWRRESAGTVVCVRDAFFNLPIRRQSHPSPAKTIDTIKQELEIYAVMFPNVSFTLQDDNKSRENDSSKGRVLRVPKTRSILAAFRHMYGRALTEHVEEVSATSGDLKVEGFISLVGARSKIYQYLYINKHPISFCDLHRLIDSKFSTSTFMKHAYDEGGETSLRASARRSPRKGEKRPIYVLNLVIPTRHIDNCLEPAKSAVHIEHKNIVTSFLSSVIDSFLVRHGFASGKRGADENLESSTKKRKIMSESMISNSMAQNITLLPATRKSEAPALFIHPGEISEKIPQTAVWQDPATGEKSIVDARSGNSYYQNSRYKVDEMNTANMNRVSRIPSLLKKDKDPEQDACSGPTSSRDTMPDWLLEALSANKAFSVTEPQIPSLLPSSNQAINDQKYTPILSHNYSCCAHTFGTPYLQSGPSSEHARIRFQKTDLLKAQVINQVDRKFIACLVVLDPSTNLESEILLEKHPAAGSTLVLIDQHAADERVRVERFLKEICSGFLQHCEGSGGVEVLELSPAVPILLTRHEASRLAIIEEVQSAFACWGVRFEGLAKLTSLEPEGAADEASGGYVQVFVQTIPAILGDKLLLNDELQDLVKGYLGTLESGEASHPNLPQQQDDELNDDESRWLKALRWCPRELLDLINSKACRGAIMFNDPLSLEQCQRLVKNLAATAFPFQCAHGRPSVVPLTHVGTKCGTQTAPALDWARLS
ncbi:hypothetical protein K503DRAFT_730324 [Rhizopogon vinicolor AM-OR11-026]|uniref:MutL C-terminal dimerisation domain-containing protein n=1 Tax=Rhizopogon vinicolor AM-OR11-026 TaxID=1314800 RepID=A0A1B7NGN4_9AGAM|nr:hypothetical protein K503DRAFT_730324 [Rhizopogon vinicolor AM-OR11-026]